MTIGERILASTLWTLIYVGFFALNYALARWILDANPSWATGYALVFAVVGIVGVPKWGDR